MANRYEPLTSEGTRFALTKHHDHDDAKDEEEDFHIRKVQELVNEKLELFAGQEKELREEKANSKNRPRVSVDEDHVNKKLTRVFNPKEVLPVVYNEVTERLKAYIKNEMKGSDINLVIQKRMFESDTRQNQNRLNMPMKQVMTHEFLREDEKEFLALHKKNEIKVQLVGPKLRVYKELMRFKAWSMSSNNKNFVLKTSWFNFWEENKEDLLVGELIQVWSFRVGDQLCFAIACVNKLVSNMKVEDRIEEGPSVAV